MKNKFETNAIRTQLNRTENLEHSVPLYLTSSFVFEDAEDMRASFAEEKQRNIYSRYSNPNSSEFIEKVCQMEGAEAGFAFASGMSAVFSTFAALLNSGDHIVSSRSVFGSTHSLFTKFFPKWNIDHSYFKVDEIESIEKLIRPNTKVLYAETPTNPGVDVLDMEALADIAKRHNLIFIVDNCFASPYLQQPIQFGADLVIHSGTKLMDGQGRVLAGITVGSHELIDKVYHFSRITREKWYTLSISSWLPTVIPASTLPCPSINLVPEWMTKSAPNCIGCCKYGEAKQLSTMNIRLCLFAISAKASISKTSTPGLVGVSA